MMEAEKLKHRVRKAREVLSVSKFKALIENAHDGIVLYDAQGIIQYASPSIRKFGGYETHDLIGRKGSDFLHPDDRASAREAFAKVLSKPGGKAALTQRFLTKDGKFLWAEYILTNHLHNPEVHGVVSNFRDVHEHVLAQQKANQNKELLTAVSLNINEAIYRSSEKKIIFVNEAFLKMFGYKDLAQVSRTNPASLYAEPVRSAFLSELKQKKRIVNKEMQYRRKDGSTFWGLLTCTQVSTPEGTYIDGAIRDISMQKQTEEALRKSREFISSINKNISEGIFRSDGKRFMYVNEAFARLFGYGDVDEILVVHPRKLYKSLKDRNAILDHLRTHGDLTNSEILYKKKNGDTFWGLVSYTRVVDQDGTLYMDGTIRDITKEKEAEMQLRLSQDLLSGINKNISEGIYRSIPSKGFVYANPAFLSLFGYRSLDELNKLKPKDLYQENRTWQAVRKEMYRTRSLDNYEVIFRKKNGVTFWGSISASLVDEKDGRTYIDGAIRDITKQKEYEQQLIDSRNFMDNVMKTVAAPIFVKDVKHRWIMFNDAFCWFLGKSRADLLGKSDKDFFRKEEVRQFWKTDNEVFRTGDVVLNRETLTLPKGEVRHLLTVKSRYINERKEKFVIGFITDITEIRRAEERMEELNASLQGIMESTHESIYALDRNFCYLAFNHNHARMAKLLYGTTIKVGDSKLSYITGTAEEKWLRRDFQRALRGEHFVTEERVSHKNYRNRIIESTYNPIFGAHKKVTGVAVFVRDITEIHTTRRAISQTNATLRGVLESTRDQIIAVDRRYRYMMYNRSHEFAMKRLGGAAVKRGASILDVIPKSRRKIAKTEIDRCLKGDNFTSEYQLGENVVLEALYNCIRDADSKIIGVAIFMRDVTTRKRTEKKLKLLNEELVQQNWQLAAQEEELKSTLEELSERNFELDQLMYKTSHDLRSPLSSILGLVNLANLDADKTNSVQYLGKIEGRIKKLDEFIKSMLTYAQVNRRDKSYEEINLLKLAKECVRELDHLDNYSDINVEISSVGKATFKNDPLRVRIVFSNIISNAFKYYNPRVDSYLKISIEVKRDAAVIVFKDNGIGINPEYIDKVFDMFYRATERSQGSGLGMYIVKQAVEKLSGRITVRSVAAKGTTFKVTLPNF